MAAELKILASEPEILALGATNTGHRSYVFGPDMLPEDVQTFLKKMEIISSNRISRCNFLQIMVFGWSIPLKSTALFVGESGCHTQVCLYYTPHCACTLTCWFGLSCSVEPQPSGRQHQSKDAKVLLAEQGPDKLPD